MFVFTFYGKDKDKNGDDRSIYLFLHCDEIEDSARRHWLIIRVWTFYD